MHSKGEHVPYFHPTTEEVCAWHYINSPRWFENLRTIKLAADYRMDDFVDLFRVEKMIRPIMDGLQFLLSQNCNLHRSPFGNPHWQIQIEFPNLFICTFHWREFLTPTVKSRCKAPGPTRLTMNDGEEPSMKMMFPGPRKISMKRLIEPAGTVFGSRGQLYSSTTV